MIGVKVGESRAGNGLALHSHLLTHRAVGLDWIGACQPFDGFSELHSGLGFHARVDDESLPSWPLENEGRKCHRLRRSDRLGCGVDRIDFLGALARIQGCAQGRLARKRRRDPSNLEVGQNEDDAKREGAQAKEHQDD